jgi:hypothetical protein
VADVPSGLSLTPPQELHTARRPLTYCKVMVFVNIRDTRISVLQQPGTRRKQWIPRNSSKVKSLTPASAAYVLTLRMKTTARVLENVFS